MKWLRQRARLRRWRRERPRWPLTRQISLVFALAMLANATVVISVSSLWDGYIVDREFSTMSPGAKRALDLMEAGGIPAVNDIISFHRELRPVQQRLEQRSSFVLYGLVALAALVTFALGYAILGRMGKGLVNVADAARLIAGGDLTARAASIRRASREEAQLTTDFNAMSASLQRAERELAESTASIAHELRTPLTILRGRLHGISDGVFELAPAEIDGLLSQVEGLGRLVDDLQTLSLATSRRLTLHVGDTDLADEVRRVLAATRPDLENAGLDLVLDLAGTPLRADGARMRQAIAAVLANVERYAAGSGALRITTRKIDGEAVLTIADNGPGLPPNAVERAFDRFWRGETSRSRETGGSGLGLAVVRAIVEAHAGHSTLQSGIGGGTVLEIRLPGAHPLHQNSTRS